MPSSILCRLLNVHFHHGRTDRGSSTQGALLHRLNSPPHLQGDGVEPERAEPFLLGVLAANIRHLWTNSRHKRPQSSKDIDENANPPQIDRRRRGGRVARAAYLHDLGRGQRVQRVLVLVNFRHGAHRAQPLPVRRLPSAVLHEREGRARAPGDASQPRTAGRTRPGRRRRRRGCLLSPAATAWRCVEAVREWGREAAPGQKASLAQRRAWGARQP